MKFNFRDMDFEGLQAEASAALQTALDGLLEGAAADLQQFVIEIGNDMTEAAVTGQTDLIDDLVDQLELVAEQNRIRLSNVAAETLRRTVRAVAKFILGLVVPTPA